MLVSRTDARPLVALCVDVVIVESPEGESEKRWW
jgi:hypothetical protein